MPIEREHERHSRSRTTSARSRFTRLSDVSITFDQDTDRHFARQQVFNRLGDLDLPTGVTPSISPLTSPSGLIYRYTLQSPDRSPTELKTFEDWTVEPQFRSVPGVADDSGFGGGTMQYQVLLDQYRLAGAGLSPQQVESALARQQRQRRRRLLFAGRPILLRARPRPDPDPRGHRQRRGRRPRRHPGAGQGRRPGRRSASPRASASSDSATQNDAVEGVIMLRTGDKTQDVLKRVEAKTQELNSSILPKDVKVLPFYDRSRPRPRDRAHRRKATCCAACCWSSWC